METHQVVPDLLDTVPSHVAVVKYPNGLQMNLGNELSPGEVKEQPSELDWPTEADTLYTVLFTDLDVPTRQQPTMAEVLHWLVVNVPRNDLRQGDTVYDYVGSGAPEGMGLHRYVLVVFPQSGVLSLNELKQSYNASSRFKFSTRNFVAKHQLGAPVAGNFFLAQCDDHVRQRRAGLLSTKFTSELIIPDILDTVPQYSLEVIYPSGVFLNHGNELTPTQVKDLPTLITWNTEPNTLYTLVFTDCGARGAVNPKYREILHWLVVNITGTDIASGETYTGYVGSGPPQGSGLRRYVYLVFKQQGPITALSQPKASSRSRAGRLGFNTRALVSEQNLVPTPVGGNFYYAQYDDYVPLLHAQLQD